jgi:hypothetical protein
MMQSKTGKCLKIEEWLSGLQMQRGHKRGLPFCGSAAVLTA